VTTKGTLGAAATLDGESGEGTLGEGLPVGFPTWEATHPSAWNGHYEQQLAV
jgi:hypothetical protein